MMPNVVRGDRMAGLMTYLVGPGRHNEHTDPHLVAGDDALMAWHSDDELGRNAGLAIARHLDRPRTAFGVEVPGGHVWHCSLSLRAEEGEQSDEKWAQIARDFVAAMGFDDGVKAPVRWVAVRHGVSTAGNDHVHLVVNLVREDGTKASTHRDFHRAQQAARVLEKEHGLEQLESATQDRSTRGWQPAERESLARRRAEARYERDAAAARTPWTMLPAAERRALVDAEMTPDQPRHALARTVRGCATASQDEAEFVRRLRGAGVLVRPRYADGRADVVTGYSVARRPEVGERPIWYGGGSLGRDLALPRLRAEWPDSPQGASAAAAEWNAAKRSRRVVAPGRETRQVDPAMWQRCASDLEQLREQLRQVPLEDRDTWARLARYTAGAYAAWSGTLEPTPGPLAEAADVLGRSAQTFRRETGPSKAGRVALSGAAMLVASAARGGQGAVAHAALLRQLIRLSAACYDAAVAGQQLRQAEAIRDAVRGRLSQVHARMKAEAAQPPTLAPAAPAPVGTAAPANLTPEQQDMLRRAQASQARRASEAVSPVPTRLEPQERRTTIRPDADRGPER